MRLLKRSLSKTRGLFFGSLAFILPDWFHKPARETTCCHASQQSPALSQTLSFLETETLVPFEALLHHKGILPLPDAYMPDPLVIDAAKRYLQARKREGGSEAVCKMERKADVPFCLLVKQMALRREARLRRAEPRALQKSATQGMLSLRQYADLDLPAFKKQIQRHRNQFPAHFIENVGSLLEPLTQKPQYALFLAALLEEHLPAEASLKLVLGFYKIAATSEDTQERDRAQYRLGLLCLLSHQTDAAKVYLESLISGDHDHDYRSRALYWRAVLAEESQELSLASSLRKKLLTEYPLSVHAIYINIDHGLLEAFPEHLQLDLKVLARLRTEKGANAKESNQRLRAIEALLYLNEISAAKEALDLSLDAFDQVEPETKLYIAVLSARMEHFLATFRMLSGAFRENRELITHETMSLYYPTDVLIDAPFLNFNLDPTLMTSLIRQESAFQKNAVSHAGAIGLMQVMPKTARIVQKTQTRQKLMDPTTNLQIGSKFFRQLLDEYSDDVEFSLAAYNAGSHRITDWQRRYVTHNRRLFVDLIPFKETREYIASIARNYYWYTISKQEGRETALKSLQNRFVIFKKY